MLVRSSGKDLPSTMNHSCYHVILYIILLIITAENSLKVERTIRVHPHHIETNLSRKGRLHCSRLPILSAIFGIRKINLFSRAVTIFCKGAIGFISLQISWCWAARSVEGGPITQRRSSMKPSTIFSATLSLNPVVLKRNVRRRLAGFLCRDTSVLTSKTVGLSLTSENRRSLSTLLT